MNTKFGTGRKVFPQENPKFMTLPWHVRMYAYSVAQSYLTLVTPWTGAHQAPLYMGLSWQESWNGLPFLPPEDLPDSGIKTVSPALACGFFTTEPPGKPWLGLVILNQLQFYKSAPPPGTFDKAFECFRLSSAGGRCYWHSGGQGCC